MDLHLLGRLDRAFEFPVDEDVPDDDIGLDLAALADDQDRFGFDPAFVIAVDAERAGESQLTVEFGAVVEEPRDAVLVHVEFFRIFH